MATDLSLARKQRIYDNVMGSGSAEVQLAEHSPTMRKQLDQKQHRYAGRFEGQVKVRNRRETAPGVGKSGGREMRHHTHTALSTA